MVATAQRFMELHPHVDIRRKVRSLQEFADYPIEELAKRFDLLVIDHPSTGQVAEHDALLPLDDYLPRRFLQDQARNSVGRSMKVIGLAAISGLWRLMLPPLSAGGDPIF